MYTPCPRETSLARIGSYRLKNRSKSRHKTSARETRETRSELAAGHAQLACNSLVIASRKVDVTYLHTRTYELRASPSQRYIRRQFNRRIIDRRKQVD